MDTHPKFTTGPAVRRAALAYPSMRKFADALGCSVQFVSRMSNGHARVSVKLAERIESLTGVPKHELMPDRFVAPSA